VSGLETRQPVFLLGGHRSGTTLLQRILNSYDDVRIWGEHEGFLQDVAQAFFRGWESTHLFEDSRPPGGEASDPTADWQAWMNGFTKLDWEQRYRELVEALLVPGGLPGKRFWGFKEIRYGAATDRTIEFLRQLYPDALFAFIVRDPFNALASARRRPERARSLVELKAACDEWVARYRTYRRWHASGDIRSFWLRYEDMIQGEGALLDLLGRMGKSLGPSQRSVMASEGGRGSSFRTEDYNARWNALPAAWLGVIDTTVGDLAGELGYPPHRLPFARRAAGRAAAWWLRLRPAQTRS
jgi:hypothetical protein